jgi:hypothetical protein
MRRIKILFAMWLPLLWLAAAAGISDGAPTGPSGAARAFLSTADADRNQRGPAGDDCASKQLARSMGRRVGTPSGSDPTTSLIFTANTRFSGLEPVPALFSVVEAPAGLARTWQFYLRAASEPRAPSAVS